MTQADFAEEPPLFEDERKCMKSVENSYALASSVRDLNCRGIHLRWSFSLSLFDQRGSSAESKLWVDPFTEAVESKRSASHREHLQEQLFGGGRRVSYVVSPNDEDEP